MAVLLESPWYQQIVREGEVRMARGSIVDALDARFGEVPSGVAQQVSRITDLDRLKELLRKAITAETPEEFARFLAE